MTHFAQANCLFFIKNIFLLLFTRQQCLFGWRVEGLFVSVGLSHSVEITAWSDGHWAEGFFFVFGCTRSECTLSEGAVKQHHYKHVHANIDSWTLSFPLSFLLPLVRTHKFVRGPWGPGQNVNLSTWLPPAAEISMLNSQQHLLVETGTENNLIWERGRGEIKSESTQVWFM